MNFHFKSTRRQAQATFAFAALLFMSDSLSAEAQTAMSCIGKQSGGCYDFTITDSKQTTGFIQVQVLYKQSSDNVMSIYEIQAVYADAKGIDIPRSEKSTDFAPRADKVSLLSKDATFTWGERDEGQREISNLTLSFTSSSFGGEVILESTENYFFNITVNSRDFNCGEGGCLYRSTDLLAQPPIGTAMGQENGPPAIPEIDAAQLPQALLVMATAYVIWRRQRSQRPCIPLKVAP